MKLWGLPRTQQRYWNRFTIKTCQRTTLSEWNKLPRVVPTQNLKPADVPPPTVRETLQAQSLQQLTNILNDEWVPPPNEPTNTDQTRMEEILHDPHENLSVSLPVHSSFHHHLISCIFDFLHLLYSVYSKIWICQKPGGAIFFFFSVLVLMIHWSIDCRKGAI